MKEWTEHYGMITHDNDGLYISEKSMLELCMTCKIPKRVCILDRWNETYELASATISLLWLDL